jgi:putative phage-type endonuclease
MGRLSAEQIEARRHGIGSSDVATVLGLSPYRGCTPLALWLEKTGQAVEVGEDDEDGTHLEIGHLFEPVLVKLFEARSGLTVATQGEGVESVSHPDHPWRRANLDGRVVGQRAAVEVKCVGIGMARDWDLTSDDGIPHYVRCQVAWQMHVADLDLVWVVALVGGPTGFRVFEVKRDLELERAIVSACEAFWARVQSREAPELDGSRIARAWLDRLYPPREPEVVYTLEEADYPVLRLGMARLDAAAREKAAKAEKDALGNELVRAMGERECDVLICDDWRASYRVQGKKGRVLSIRSRRPLGALTTGNPDDGEVM